MMAFTMTIQWRPDSAMNPTPMSVGKGSPGGGRRSRSESVRSIGGIDSGSSVTASGAVDKGALCTTRHGRPTTGSPWHGRLRASRHTDAVGLALPDDKMVHSVIDGQKTRQKAR
jgi:hypothetical protein